MFRYTAGHFRNVYVNAFTYGIFFMQNTCFFSKAFGKINAAVFISMLNHARKTKIKLTKFTV